MPCGRCRQLLFEHCGRGMLLDDRPGHHAPMDEVLPDAFGPAATSEAVRTEHA